MSTRVVHAVLLRHGPEHHKSAMAALCGRVLGPAFGAARHDILVVDNALDPAHAGRTPEGHVLIGGDNRRREFSGWEKGLARMGAADFGPDDAVLLVNDTFHRNYDVRYLERFGQAPVEDWLAAGGLLGHVDLYPREVALFGLPLRFWLRSSLILCRWGALSRLLPLAVDMGEDGDNDSPAVFHSDPRLFLNPEGPLCPRYQGYLKSFLLGRDGEYRARWHSLREGEPQGRQQWAGLRAKAACILREHLFSARAQALGVPLCDVSGRLAERVAAMDAMARRDAGGGRA